MGWVGQVGMRCGLEDGVWQGGWVGLVEWGGWVWRVGVSWYGVVKLMLMASRYGTVGCGGVG